MAGGKAAVCRHGSRTMELRVHIFNHICEAESGRELESDILALARPHFLNLPNRTASWRSGAPIHGSGETFLI